MKESKSAATIRRRRQRNPGLADITFRQKQVHDDDNLDSDEEDVDFLLDEPIRGPPILRLIMKSQWTLFLGLLAFRVVNALVIQTSYVPDEYWQSLEVAHNMAFGYGHLTWEWKTGLRGYSYPLMFSAIYKVLGILHLDNRILMLKLPRVLQAVFAAVADLYLYKLSRKLSGQKVAQWTLLCQLTSWFMFYCCTRTLTNAMETALTTVALYYFPWPGRSRKAHWKYVSVVGLAVVVRPTAAILWLPLCLGHLWLWRHVAWKVLRLFAERGFLILSLSSIVDRMFYGKWVYVHYNFLQFNFLSNMGTFYGSHPWHWYLTQGFIVVMGTHIFPFLLGVRKTLEPVFSAVIGWTVLIYSLLGHKEFRFLMPVMPMAMHISGKYLHYITEDTEEEEDEEDDEDEGYKARLRQRQKANKSPWSRKEVLIVLLIVTNLPLALYTSLLHQRGTVDVMKYLHDEASLRNNRTMSIFYLMPCHSTPYYSYLHRNVSMRFLTCEPNLDDIPDYLDEAGIFYNDPVAWLEQYELQLTHHLHTRSGRDPSLVQDAEQRRLDLLTSDLLPSHLVLFNVLQPSLAQFVASYKYRACAKFFHSHVPEGRVGSHVIVLCHPSWTAQRHKPSQKPTR